MFFIKNFIIRGLTAAWAGPVVLAIVYLCLHGAGVVSAVEADVLFKAIVSSVIMAFVAGGIGCIYKVERLPLAIATLLHVTILYFDYLVFYLINAYLPNNAIWIFTAIYLAGFALIWLIIYFAVVRRNVNKLNKKLCK